MVVPERATRTTMVVVEKKRRVEVVRAMVVAMDRTADRARTKVATERTDREKTTLLGWHAPIKTPRYPSFVVAMTMMMTTMVAVVVAVVLDNVVELPWSTNVVARPQPRAVAFAAFQAVVRTSVVPRLLLPLVVL